MVQKTRVRWFLLSLITLITVGGNYLINKTEKGLHFTSTTSTLPIRPSLPLLSLKHVTKSLTELGPMDELNSYVLFFNRVPNSGSEILTLLLQRLQGWNNFKHVRLKGGEKKKLNRVEQEGFVYEVCDLIRHHAVPLIFDRYVYFINFISFDRQSPKFFNLIRDPIDKLLSSKNISSLEECLRKRRSECNFSDDLSIPYFCGQDTRCSLLNDKWALNMAKANVNRYYSVVGVLEELNTTLHVFETKLPYFFKGVKKLFYTQLLGQSGSKIKKKTKIKPELRKYIKKKFITEYEFYEWIKIRLLNQFQRFTLLLEEDIK